MMRRNAIVIMLGGWMLLALAGPWLAPQSMRAQNRAAVLEAPSAQHWLGTDEFGRDEMARLLMASGLTTMLALAMALPALALAVALGVGAAMTPAAQPLARSAGEIARSLPWIFVLVAVRALLPLDAGPWLTGACLAGLFAVASWPVAAWTLQGAARGLMQQDFVRAASGLGENRRQLLLRHLWPHLRGLIATYFALLLAGAIGAEVGLELVGLGLPQPWPTWGNMLLPLADYTIATRCWWLYAPLLLIVPVLLALTLAAGHQEPASQLG
ncbi:MAG: ABC transporter permease [Terriglobales bacterium]